MSWTAWFQGRRQRESILLLSIAFWLIMVISLATNLPSLKTSGKPLEKLQQNEQAEQNLGQLATMLAEKIYTGLGVVGAWIVLAWWGWGILCLMLPTRFPFRPSRCAGWALLLMMGCFLTGMVVHGDYTHGQSLWTIFGKNQNSFFQVVGLLGYIEWQLMGKTLGPLFASILSVPLLIISISLVTGVTPFRLFQVVAAPFLWSGRRIQGWFEGLSSSDPASRRDSSVFQSARRDADRRMAADRRDRRERRAQARAVEERRKDPRRQEERKRKTPKPVPNPMAVRTVKEKSPRPPSPPKVLREGRTQGGKLPSLELLDSPPLEQQDAPISTFDERIMGEKLIEALRHFDVHASVDGISTGPVVTRFELKPEPGVKISKIVGLSNDLALALKATKVRIEAPIPGKAAVGVEVPNPKRSDVYLKEILASTAFRKVRSPLALAIGKDIAGFPLTADLMDMPHLLIAGATGSGKTVCLHALIASILFNSTPDKVRLLMIDPKMIELSMYDGIPNLLAPVVRDVKKAAAYLDWLVAQMDDRYKRFSEAGVQDLESYNAAVKKGQIPEGEHNGPLPYVMLVIDELADLMMLASRKVEDALTRLAQLARTAGIHAIIATQRPSVDVITGLIKANFPSRIAFRVTSKTDSRTILDMNGAESLIGKGDMLFLSVGGSKPTRAQCAYLSKEEIKRLTRFLKGLGAPQYMEGLPSGEALEQDGMQGDQEDEYYDQAVELVARSGKASASNLQRRLRIGYNRAARLVELMEQRGLVGPDRGPRGREVFISPEDRDGRGG